MGAVMDLGGGNRVSFGEAIATLGEVMGLEPRLSQQAAEAGDVRDTYADEEGARALVAYSPNRSLRSGLCRSRMVCSELLTSMRLVLDLP